MSDELSQLENARIKHASESDECDLAPHRTIYFADNFRLLPWPEAEKRRQNVEALCVKQHLKPLWPSEHFLFPNLLPLGETIDFEKVPKLLAKAPFVNIPSAQAVIADFSPFRGLHLNPQIAFEAGVAVTIGKPVFAWTNATYPTGQVSSRASKRRPRLLDDRLWSGERAGYGGHWFSEDDGLLVENFGMVECAAIAGNVQSLSCSIEEAIAACATYFDRRMAPPN
jgi:nucleoside 2-deoxyribosyltransferase